MTAEETVRIARIVDAPREEVFRAWTEPEEIRKWWGPGEFTCPEAHVDLRPGGSYRLAMVPPPTRWGGKAGYGSSRRCSPGVAQLERLREVLES
jgi:uncharacterized protein YndB with AHSA1/START domain